MIGMTNSLKINLSRDVIGTYVGSSRTTGGSQFINLGFTPTEVTVTCPSYPTNPNRRYGGTATATVDGAGNVWSVNNAVIAESYIGNVEHLKYDTSQLSQFYHYVTVAIVKNGFYVFYCDPGNGHSQTDNYGVTYNYVAKR